MKVLTREAFLRMPVGTAYCKGKRWYFDELAFKGDTCFSDDGRPIDWFALNPAWVDGEDSNECFDRLEDMLANGTSYPMQDSIGRDGCFDDEDLFLVFEKDDLAKLREWIDAAIEAAD